MLLITLIKNVFKYNFENINQEYLLNYCEFIEQYAEGSGTKPLSIFYDISNILSIVCMKIIEKGQLNLLQYLGDRFVVNKSLELKHYYFKIL